MEPNVEDVLFLDGYPIDDYKKDVEIIRSNIVTNEMLKKLILSNLSGKYYKGFVKYFTRNYEKCLDASKKSREKSTEYRASGNQLFAKPNHDSETHEELWKLYSQSVAFAPIGSEELALAYGNRSYLLLHLKKYQSCIKDIDRAIAITKSNVLKVKWMCRKMSCYVFTNSARKEKEELWQNIKAHLDKVDEASKDERLLKVVQKAQSDVLNKSHIAKQDENAFSHSLSQSKISVGYKGKAGRHAVSNQNFATGDLVAVIKPVITSVNIDKFYAYCNHCLSQMWAGIPCDECSLSMYCSEECKMTAWEKYHQVECKILPHMNFDHLYFYSLQLSVRAFILGIREMSSITELKEKTKEIDSWRDDKGIMQNDKTFDSNFLSLYSLPYVKSHVKDLTYLLRHSKNACLLMVYVTQTCDIFGKNMKSSNVKELMKDDDFLFLSALMLKLVTSSCLHGERVESLAINNHPCNKYSDITECMLHRCCLRGMYIDPLVKNVKSSCNPNVSVLYTDDFGKILYYCTNPIKAKDEILLAQFDEFWKTERKERKKKMEQLRYSCKCIACKEHWSTTNKLMESYQHRRSLMYFEEKELLEKYLGKHSSKVVLTTDPSAQISEKELQELAEDTNYVFERCGQPSFLTSSMLSILIIAFERLYGARPLQLPEEC